MTNAGYCLAQTSDPVTGRELLADQNGQLATLVKTNLGEEFLQSVPYLPAIDKRVVYCRRGNSRNAVSASDWEALSPGERESFELRELDEHYYYFTRYGTPLAFVRPLDIAGNNGIDSLSGLRVIDFGFGTIGHLRMMATQGADVTGIEIDRLLQALYGEPGDTGAIGGNPQIAKDHSGHLELLFDRFPEQLEATVRGQADLFVSKNTLKRGYIHPEREVDPDRLINLGCSDEEFLDAVHGKLKTGGLFLIYNLHPAQAPADEPYIPWADGRSPFDRTAFEQAGFEVLAWNVDDSVAAREMGRALQWEKQMDLEDDLFATYTLARKH
ncbi:MAG: class I SAM-dependent methyltransferase [Pirellulaceae bacterium]